MLRRFQPCRYALIHGSAVAAGCPAAAQEQRCSSLQALKKRPTASIPPSSPNYSRPQKKSRSTASGKLADSQGGRGVACLSEMLKSEYFGLFLPLRWRQLAVAPGRFPAVAAHCERSALRSDLGEINAAGYVELVLELAQHGVDTRELAEKYMNYPEVEGDIAEHSLPVDRATGAIFLYGSMPAERADKSLVPLLSSKEADVHGTAALQLALNMTKESYRALAGLPAWTTCRNIARKQVIAALAYHPPDEKAIPTYSREQVLTRLRTLPRTAGTDGSRT